MGATNLIPGPNSTELAIHLGHERARWRGLVLAGVLFILPAAVIVTVIAWFYVEYGDTPTFDHVLYGVVPVVVAIIVWALVPLGRAVVKSLWLAVLLAAGLAAYLLGVNELVVLFGGAGDRPGGPRGPDAGRFGPAGARAGDAAGLRGPDRRPARPPCS